jgi:hypothetical protein
MSSDFSDSPQDNPAGSTGVPLFSNDWDRYLNVYNIQELPLIAADGDPGSEVIPVGIKVLREFLLEAANKYASEVWFDFNPGVDNMIDVCYSTSGKGTSAVRIPKSLLFNLENVYGIFGILLEMSGEEGMFAIHVNEFRDTPSKKRDPFDKRGRIIQPPVPPGVDSPFRNSAPLSEEDQYGLPGIAETVTIRAFRICLKGHEIPQDMVIQICPRFWYMPTGFTME